MSLDFTLSTKVDTGGGELYTVVLGSWNITSNLVPMWIRAGVRSALYDSTGKMAKDIIDDLDAGIVHMLEHPDWYRAMEPDNGWGTYENALLFLYGIIKTCIKHPKAVIHSS